MAEMRERKPPRSTECLRSSDGSFLRGFTLLELVVVMLVITLLSSLALPLFANSGARHRVEAASNRLVTDFNLARRHARVTSSDVSVTFEPTGSSYTLSGLADLEHPDSAYRVVLADEPYGVTIATVNFGGDQTVIFNGHGIPDTGGSVQVRSAGFTARVTLLPDTGELTRVIEVSGTIVPLEPNKQVIPVGPNTPVALPSMD